MSLTYENLTNRDKISCDSLVKLEKEILTNEDFMQVISNILNNDYLHVSFFIFCYINKNSVLDEIMKLIKKSVNDKFIKKLGTVYEDIKNNWSFYVYKSEIYDYYRRKESLNEIEKNIFKIIEQNNYTFKFSASVKENVLLLSFTQSFKNGDSKNFGINKLKLPDFTNRTTDEIFIELTRVIFGTKNFTVYITNKTPYSSSNGIFTYNPTTSTITINKQPIEVNNFNIEDLKKFFNSVPKIIHRAYFTKII